jgi:WD40 repeat protein
MWNPNEKASSESVVSVEDHQLHYWKIKDDHPIQVSVISQSPKYKFLAASWNPFHPEAIASTNESTVRGWDLRTSKYQETKKKTNFFFFFSLDNQQVILVQLHTRETFNISNAHTHFTRDIDFNPKQEFIFATGGDDYKIKFWDMRKTTEPLKAFSGHTHWFSFSLFFFFLFQKILHQPTIKSKKKTKGFGM